MTTLSPTVAVPLALLALALVGLTVILRARRQLSEKLAFAQEYRSQLDALLEHTEQRTYEWLTLNANRMQAQMGPDGVVRMKPPHANYMVNNYAIVPNGLAEIRKFLSDEFFSQGDLPGQYHALIDDALLRHQGTLLQGLEINGASVRNPFKWLAVGTQVVLALPLWLLASMGVFSRAFASRLKGSSSFRVFSGLVATVGLVSAIIGIVTGWEQFIALARKVVPGAF